MKIILLIYCAWGVFGGALAALQAFRYWRSDVKNSQRIAGLWAVKSVLDLGCSAGLLWLWYNEWASEWTLFMWSAIPIGIYSIAIRLALDKLTTGKVAGNSPPRKEGCPRTGYAG